MHAILFRLIAAAIALAACSEQPERETSAIVVNIAPGFSPKWNTDEVQITAKSPDGLVVIKNVLKAQLKCRVGDRVRASVRGIVLKLDDRACIG